MKGEGNQQDYGMRVYDPRLEKFLSVDPLTKGYPWYTPYQFAGNTPIQAIDLDGEEELHHTLTKNDDGSASLKLTNMIFVQKKDWFYKAFGVFNTREGEARIPERAVINYGDKKYYIGFSGSKGRGNEGGMEFFKSIRRNPNEVLYAVDNVFLDEEQSKSVEAFSMAVNTQNNTAMYGPLTSRAWYTANEKGNPTSSSLNSTLRVIDGAKARVAKRVLGLRDRALNDLDIRFFGSRVRGDNRLGSDLDVLILTERTDLFTEGSRLYKIIKSIEADFKKETGLKLDINIMERSTYRNAKGGQFSTSVKANNEKVIKR